MARTPMDVDLERVRYLASIGSSKAEVCTHIGMTYEGMMHRKDINQAYIKGRHLLKESLRAKQVELAMQGDKTMLVWLGKQYLGQREDPTPEDTEESNDIDFKITLSRKDET